MGILRREDNVILDFVIVELLAEDRLECKVHENPGRKVAACMNCDHLKSLEFKVTI